MMKRTLLLTALAAAALAGAALALNPKTLVLQRSDMPAGAKRVSFGSSKGAIKIPRVVHGRSAYVGWSFRNGGAKETVAAGAGVVASTRDAHAVFVYVKKLFRKVRARFKLAALPHYGDEQFAVVAAPGGGIASGVVFVRSGARVWEVVVYGYPKFTRARVIGELKKYAVKEKSRAT